MPDLLNLCFANLPSEWLSGYHSAKSEPFQIFPAKETSFRVLTRIPMIINSAGNWSGPISLLSQPFRTLPVVIIVYLSKLNLVFALPDPELFLLCYLPCRSNWVGFAEKDHCSSPLNCVSFSMVLMNWILRFILQKPKFRRSCLCRHSSPEPLPFRNSVCNLFTVTKSSFFLSLPIAFRLISFPRRTVSVRQCYRWTGLPVVAYLCRYFPLDSCLSGLPTMTCFPETELTFNPLLPVDFRFVPFPRRTVSVLSKSLHGKIFLFLFCKSRILIFLPGTISDNSTFPKQELLSLCCYQPISCISFFLEGQFWFRWNQRWKIFLSPYKGW